MKIWNCIINSVVLYVCYYHLDYNLINKNNNLAISDELIMINVVIIDSVSGTTFGVRMFDKKCLTSNSGLTND